MCKSQILITSTLIFHPHSSYQMSIEREKKTLKRENNQNPQSPQNPNNSPKSLTSYQIQNQINNHNDSYASNDNVLTLEI